MPAFFSRSWQSRFSLCANRLVVGRNDRPPARATRRAGFSAGSSPWPSRPHRIRLGLFRSVFTPNKPAKSVGDGTPDRSGSNLFKSQGITPVSPQLPPPDAGPRSRPAVSSDALCETLIGRRVTSRFPIDLAARFIAPGINIRLQFEDVSASGACMRLMYPRCLTEGRLQWLDYSCFVEVIWQAELRCGLRFVDPLDVACLRRTLEFGESSHRGGEDTLRRLASAWVHGPGDW